MSIEIEAFVLSDKGGFFFIYIYTCTWGMFNSLSKVKS